MESLFKREHLRFPVIGLFANSNVCVQEIFEFLQFGI